MQIEAPQRLSTAIMQLPTGDSVVEALVDLQVEPPSVISWDQVCGEEGLKIGLFIYILQRLQLLTSAAGVWCC